MDDMDGYKMLEVSVSQERAEELMGLLESWIRTSECGDPETALANAIRETEEFSLEDMLFMITVLNKSFDAPVVNYNKNLV